MRDDSWWPVIGFLIVEGVFMFIAGLIGWSMCDSAWEYDMVQRGYAEHNSKTGAWQWKAEAKE